MHIKHIYRKLGVKNRVQAVAQAHVLGLLSTTLH
jgi:DNA-binding CsgD family transcriptional regulator